MRTAEVRSDLDGMRKTAGRVIYEGLDSKPLMGINPLHDGYGVKMTDVAGKYDQGPACAHPDLRSDAV